MKFVFSFVKNKIGGKETHPALAALSNFHIQAQGYETIFFGDEEGLKTYSNVQFDQKEMLRPDEVHVFPDHVWSLGKLVAIKKVKEPCLHLDLDLVYTKILPQSLEENILCLHDESFHTKSHILMQELYKIRPKGTEHIPTLSYNCGLFGGQDKQTIDKAIDLLFDFINDNFQYISIVSEHYGAAVHSTLLIEQIWLMQIIKSLGRDISTLCKIPAWNKEGLEILDHAGITHYMGAKEIDIYIQEILARAHSLRLKY
jgi:hypothetical protein